MKYVKPNEINNMQDSEEVYVNRIDINSRLIKISLLEKRDYEAEKILFDALASIKKREKGPRITVWELR